jgi:hypothetical protein
LPQPAHAPGQTLANQARHARQQALGGAPASGNPAAAGVDYDALIAAAQTEKQAATYHLCDIIIMTRTLD